MSSFRKKIKQKVHTFINTNWVAKVIVISMFWVFGLIPTWLYLITRWFLDPIGFAQEFLLFAIFAIIIGWVQVILIGLATTLTGVILFDGGYS